MLVRKGCRLVAEVVIGLACVYLALQSHSIFSWIVGFIGAIGMIVSVVIGLIELDDEDQRAQEP